MRTILALSALVVGTALLSGAPAQARDYGPDTCRQGYVWREAFPGDRVCVTPAERRKARYNNERAGERRQPGGGAYGADTCRPGYVWREAFAGDRVCVTPRERERVRRDNSRADGRYVY